MRRFIWILVVWPLFAAADHGEGFAILTGVQIEAVRGDQYCSQWLPGDFWACYVLQKDGLVIRFIGADGSVSEGVYVDD